MDGWMEGERRLTHSGISLSAVLFARIEAEVDLAAASASASAEVKEISVA